MPLPRTRVDRRVLTASASRLDGDQTRSEVTKRRGLPWQTRALQYIDIVPELQYASRFYARMLKQLRIFPAIRDNLGHVKPLDDTLPVETLDRVQDPGGGRSQIQGRYGELMFTTGEGILFGRDLESDDEQWSFIWNDELETEKTGNRVKKYIWKPNGQQGEKFEYMPTQAVAYRFWTPHPRQSGEATSPMRAGLDVAEELIVLTQAVAATATSRKTSGVWAMPSEIAPPPAEAGSDEDPKMDPFMEDLVNHLTAQIENAGSPEAAAPFVLFGAYEFLDKVQWFPLYDPQNSYAEQSLRKEAVERLARGMDFPPEVLTGLSDSNHWAARQILDDMWRSHGAPIAEQFCDDLNQSYFRPALRDAGYPDWKRVVIDFDESDVVVKPDRSEEIFKALDMEIISQRYAREELGIPETAAPDETERELIRVAKNGGAAERDQSRPNVDQGPPEPGPEGDSGRRTRVVASAGREVGAVEMAVHRCREMAGNRIRQKQKQCPECLEPAVGKPIPLVASAVGAENVKRLGLDPRELVSGGSASLRIALGGWGFSMAQADSICEMVELFAARTLFASTFEIPSGMESQIEQMRMAV